MVKSRSSLGRNQGPAVAWKLDDRTGVLAGDYCGFTAKANAQRPSIVRILPEVEIVNGQPVIQPMRFQDDDGVWTTSDFFRKVTVAEIGSGSSFTCFIADPSDADEDMPPSDFPVRRVRTVLEDAIAEKEAWANAYASWFMPHGKYQTIDFPWPLQYTVLQCFAYLQPGCNHRDTIEKHASRLTAHPQFGNVLAQPEMKFMFIKGSGAEALADVFLGIDEETQEFKVPADVLGPNNPLGVYISGEKEVDEAARTERSICTVQPFDLAANGFYVPDEAALVQWWRPWDKVFRKMTYSEQVKKLAQIFGNELINYVFGPNGGTQDPVNVAPAGPQGAPQQPQAPAGPQGAPQGWGAPQAPAGPQGAPQAPAGPQGAPQGWGGQPQAPAGPQGAPQAPAGPQGAPQQGIADASSTTPETPAGVMTAEAVRDRFSKYKQSDGQG